jgi:hypothetical protein
VAAYEGPISSTRRRGKWRQCHCWRSICTFCFGILNWGDAKLGLWIRSRRRPHKWLEETPELPSGMGGDHTNDWRRRRNCHLGWEAITQMLKGLASIPLLPYWIGNSLG